MFSRIVLVARSRDDFSFRRRSFSQGYVLVNRNSEAVIIRAKARLKRSLVYGTVITSEEAVGHADRIISSRQVFGGDFGSLAFNLSFKRLKAMEMYYAP